MPIQLVFAGLVDVPLPWRADWAWGLPLIVLTVLIHVVGLAMTREAVLRIFNRSSQRHPTVLFVTTSLARGLFSRHWVRQRPDHRYEPRNKYSNKAAKQYFIHAPHACYKTMFSGV